MSDYWNQDARRVNGQASRMVEYRERRREEVLESTVLRYVKRGATILDAGMGNGRLLCRLCAEGYTSVGLDISQVRLERARQRLAERSLDAKLELGSIMAIPAPDCTFDAVVCSEVLEHLPNPTTALHELARVAKDGGYLIVSVPFSETLGTDICPNCGANVPRHGHIHSFDEVALKALVQQAGFTVVNARTFGCALSLRGPGYEFIRRLPRGIWTVYDAMARILLKAEWIAAVARMGSNNGRRS